MSYTTKSHFAKCSCCEHLLELQRYVEKTDEITEQGFNLSMWTYGHCGQILYFIERLKYCWKILKTGRPWADHIVLTDEQAQDIVTFIQSQFKKK